MKKVKNQILMNIFIFRLWLQRIKIKIKIKSYVRK